MQDSMNSELSAGLGPSSVSVGGTSGESEVVDNPLRAWRLDRQQFEAAHSAKPDAEARSRLAFGQRRALEGYYQRQREMIEGFSQMDDLEEHLLPTAQDEVERDALEKSEAFAIRISNIANMILLALKVYASVASRSLAIIASALDSLLDLLSGFILWYTARSMRKHNPYKYPIGKKRMQPLGIIVFASVMATLGFQVLFEAGRQLVEGSNEKPGLHSDWPWLVSIMGFVTLVKLVLFLYCSGFANDIVRTYATDHFFDVVTNVFGLVAALLGQVVIWWLDPTGAILLALYTMKNWSSTVLENVNSLTGRSAPPEYLQKLTYLCWNHHPKIILIDTVRAYTFGSHYFTEVDIVLPSEMPLHEAHDIGESLQNKLERVPEIERAFVHLDFEVSHQPEHHGPSRFHVPPPAQAASPSPSSSPSHSPSTSRAAFV